MDKLFDAMFANIIIWSTLISIVLLPKPGVTEVEQKLASMKDTLFKLEADLWYDKTNVMVINFGDEPPRDLGWSYLFAKIDSGQEELRITIVRG